MRIYRQDLEGAVSEPADLSGIALDQCRLLWVDAEDPTDGEIELLGEFFRIHPLVLGEFKDGLHMPKAQELENHLFLIWEFLRDEPSTEKIETTSVFIFLARNYLVTVHREPAPEIDAVRVRLAADPSTYRNQPAPVLYAILDTTVDSFFPLVGNLTEEIDTYMESVLTDGGAGEMKKILTLKHRNMAARRTVSAHRDVLMQLARRDVRFIPEELTVYLIDVYDHLVRIASEIENNSELISSSLDIHLSAVSNRLNVTMKRLTTIATIFMPLTFLVGLWGMNFEHIPEFSWQYGYLFAWMTIIVTSLVMVVIAWKKGWF